jgi:steroid 5-alpha reductase family enzyme
MLLLRTMINVKITNRTEKEDYVAVERETGAIALPSKHVFAIFSVGIISVLLALPFGQLIPENYSPFSALSAGLEPYGFFEFALIGGPIALATSLFMFFSNL